MKEDEIIRMAVECQLVTAGNRDGLYMQALIAFARNVEARATAAIRQRGQA